MEDVNIRLECLKLAHSHGHALERVLSTAKEYEQFVSGPKAVPLQDPPIKSGNDQKSKK